MDTSMDNTYPERASSPKKRKHEEATASEKYELFLHASRNPQLKQRELAEWFESTFHKAINQSTVSRNLKKFKTTPAPLEVRFEAGCPPLPTTSLPPHPPHALPPTPPPSNLEDFSHPELGIALHDWYVRCDDRMSISHEALKAKAEELNAQIYSEEKRKPCTNSWLDSWKRRHDEMDRRSFNGSERGASRETDEADLKTEAESSVSPKLKVEDSEEKRIRKEIKRLRKDIEKRDIQMAKAKIRKETSIRRLEELEKELGHGKL